MSNIVGIARADFKERTRRFSFIAIMASALFLAFWFVPQENVDIQVMTIQPGRFVQGGNPTWLPMASAWGLGVFLPLIGFFYLRNSIIFDEKSGVIQLVASSPIRNVRYMLGKLYSGTLQLYCIAAVVVAGSFLMVLWHFPGELLSANELLTPFIFLLTALPLCSALAILFSSVRFLRGAVGSAVFFVAFAMMYVFIADAENPGILLRSFDMSGTAVLFHAVDRAVLEQSGLPMDTFLFLGSGIEYETPPTLQLIFSGVPVTTADVQGFLGMLCVTFGLTVLSAPVYGFFQKMPKIKLPKKRRAKKSDEVAASEHRRVPEYVPAQLSARSRWLYGIVAELRLMLSGQPFFWKLISLAGIMLSIFLDLATVQIYVMPLLMVWFINVFSALGSREHQHDMLKCISVIPGGRLKQVLSSWLAGITIAMILILPVTARMMIAGQTDGAIACLAGAVFLPSLALFLGEFTKTRRGFELTFVFITYIILNDVTAFMYIGTHPDIVSVARAGIYLTIGICMNTFALVKRANV